MLSSRELFSHEKSVSEYMMESIELREKETKLLKETLKHMTPTEREFAIFKIFYNNNDKKKQKQLYEIFKNNLLMLHKIDEIKKVAEDSDYYTSTAWVNRHEVCLEIIFEYKKLLNKMATLAKELNMNNSLELSILFDYLLWNGYLSKTHKHEYKDNEETILLGMNFTDISNGIGVCRNYSEMLKDFLNHSGYNSVILCNFFDYENIVNKMLNRKSQKSNHAYNLIEDNGLYIYDSTNSVLYNLTRQDSALLAEGDYKYKNDRKYKSIIRIYRSYDLCYSKKDEKLLDRLYSEKEFISPYNKNDFISSRNVNLEIIKNNLSLLEDFYSEAKPDIIGISEETQKVLMRKNK